MRHKSLLLAVLTVISGFSLLGCQQHNVNWSDPKDGAPMPAIPVEERPRSILYGKLALVQPEAAEEMPWYASRNDARLMVQSGVQSPVLEAEYSYTYENLNQSGGNVNDYSSRITYRRRIAATSR